MVLILQNLTKIKLKSAILYRFYMTDFANAQRTGGGACLGLQGRLLRWFVNSCLSWEFTGLKI